MRVETPQILWHSEEDKGINAALMSVSMIQSGIDDCAAAPSVSGAVQYGNVLATAGNSNLIHLWKITLVRLDPVAATSSKDDNENDDKPEVSKRAITSPIFQKNSRTKIDYLCSLTRHDGPVNSVAFSPDGLHLATAGETGSVLVWSVPVSKRGNGNGRHFWATLSRENELAVRIVSHSGEGVTDLSWSADSKRFLAGSIDHSVWVCENVKYHQLEVESDWKVVYHNGMDHTHYVQGVSYDPLGAYLSSMSSDRSVRVYPRKMSASQKKQKKATRKVLRPSNNTPTDAASLQPSPSERRAVQNLLRDAKLELGRSREIRKQRRTSELAVDPTTNSNVSKQWFADESTLGSFVRRLSWTTDGAFLVTPAALWPATQSYATLLFARHRFDEPYRVLHGLEKPSVAVRPNPVLFQLPAAAKENQHQAAAGGLPYRSVFCVLTWDSVLVYDTFHTKPLALVRGLHYANLVDATWSADGHTLIVASTDGYLSLIQFAPGELGQVYQPPVDTEEETAARVPTPTRRTVPSSNTTSQLPPCEPGPVVMVDARAAKKAKRVTPTLIAPATHTSKRAAADETPVEAAVDKLTLSPQASNEVQPKKKKRIQPTLLTTQSSS